MIKQIFWRGLRVLLPPVVTVLIIFWIFTGFESLFGYLYLKIVGPRWYFPGLGFLLGITFTFTAGLLFNEWYMKKLHSWSETLFFKKIPIIKTLYSSLTDLMSFFDPNSEQKHGLPVIVDLGHLRAIGFVTIEDSDKLPRELRQNDLVCVFIPLSYQMGGLMCFVERNRITPLSLSVDRVMGFIFSAGMASNTKDTVEEIKKD